MSDLRRSQIKKILKYAKEILGLKVVFVHSEEIQGSAGGYLPPFERETDEYSGEIFVDKDVSPLNTIYILLHEIGHHIDYLKRGYVAAEEWAYCFYPYSGQKPCSPKYARLITKVEEQAIKYARELSLFLDLKLPEYSTLKDEITSRKMLKALLKKGFTSDSDRIKICREARAEARRLSQHGPHKNIKNRR